MPDEHRRPGGTAALPVSRSRGLRGGRRPAGREGTGDVGRRHDADQAAAADDGQAPDFVTGHGREDLVRVVGADGHRLALREFPGLDLSRVTALGS